MARKKRTTRKRTSRKAPGPSLLRRWWEGVSIEHRTGTVQAVLRIVALCIIVALAGWGMERLESHVRATTNTTRNSPVGLQVAGKPAWMPAELAYRIAKSFGVQKHIPYDDANLTDTITAKALANPWVRKVRSVRKSRDGGGKPFVRVDCEFRKPAAMVA
jgi:hypothetical protein